MPNRIVECVPNFSEGRDPAKVAAIREAIASAGVLILKSEMDPDHHRSVITFAGEAHAVVEGAFRGIEAARAVIDLTRHSGVHPRIGAADVVPFIPIEGVTIEDCVRLAHTLGARVWGELGIPVYFYEAAATLPERVGLENVRRGGFESPRMMPDLGSLPLHPKAGACIIGARKFLIAFNMNLTTADVGVAKEIARRVRTSSGGLPCVKALGLPLASRNQAQVSMNLTDFERTPLHSVFERVQAEAALLGTEIAGSEIIGLVPRKALEMAAAHFLRVEGFHAAQVFENRLIEALQWSEETTMKRNATAIWQGGLKDGKGSLTTASSTLSNAQYSFGTRFENGVGTNPEELLAAAHAGCFAMALSAQLGTAGMTVESIHVVATVSLEKVEGGFAITESHLELKAKIPGADQAAFDMAANAAKAGCPVSKLFNTKITMDSTLES